MIKNFQTRSGSLSKQDMAVLDVQLTRERIMAQVRKVIEDGIERPDGGDGGHGGHVYFRSSGRLSSLYDLRRAHFFGNDGTSGMAKQRNGKMGKDIYYSVPLGTEIFEIKKQNPSKSLQSTVREDGVTVTKAEECKIKIADLDQEGQSIIIARGGAGGLGNYSVRS